MKVELQGVVQDITDPKKISDKFELVIVYLKCGNTTYPIQFANEKIKTTSYAKVGDNVIVSCFLNSSPWKDTYILNLSGYFISKNSDAAPTATTTVATPTEEPIDDLPF